LEGTKLGANACRIREHQKATPAPQDAASCSKLNRTKILT
jgi:hypothetical protein